MKTLALMMMMTCGLSLPTFSASARDYEQKRDDTYNLQIAFTWPSWTWSHRLKDEITQLNRMRGHVRWLVRSHRRTLQIRRDFVQVGLDIDRINWQFRHGGYNRYHLRREVDRAHYKLHRIELALRVQKPDYYHWR